MAIYNIIIYYYDVIAVRRRTLKSRAAHAVVYRLRAEKCREIDDKIC